MKKIFFMAIMAIALMAGSTVSAQDRTTPVKPNYVFTAESLESDTTVVYTYPKGEEIDRKFLFSDMSNNNHCTWKTETSAFRVDVNKLAGSWELINTEGSIYEVFFHAKDGRKIIVLFQEG